MMINGAVTQSISDDGIVEIRDPEINVEEIMEQIRASIQERSRAHSADDVPHPNGAAPISFGSRPEVGSAAGLDGQPHDDLHHVLPHELRHNLYLANRLHDAPKSAILPTRTRLGLIGWLWAKIVLRIVNRLREFVVNSVEFQVGFNSAAVRALNEVAQVLAAEKGRSAALESRVTALTQTLQALEQRLVESEQDRSVIATRVQEAERQAVEELSTQLALAQAQLSSMAETTTSLTDRVTSVAGDLEEVQANTAAVSARTTQAVELAEGLQRVEAAISILAPVPEEVARLAAELDGALESLTRLGEHVQRAQNDAATIPSLTAQLVSVADSLQHIQVELARIDRVSDQTARLSGDLSSLVDQTATFSERVQRLESDTKAAEWAAQVASLQERQDQVETALSSSRHQRRVDWPVFDHQARFRGPVDEIKRMLGVYVPYFQPGQRVLDAGCGRGEFLLSLREAGVGAYGVDLDGDMVRYCQRHQLEVYEGDVLTHLQSLPEKSLDGIFAGHIIEHLDLEQQMIFYREAFRTLKAGSYLVCETPNPLTLVTAATSFIIDPTHQNPIHPQTLKFLLESCGFNDIEIRFSIPHPEEAHFHLLPPDTALGPSGSAVETLNQDIARLNQLLFGPQNYAAIARR